MTFQSSNLVFDRVIILYTIYYIYLLDGCEEGWLDADVDGEDEGCDDGCEDGSLLG